MELDDVYARIQAELEKLNGMFDPMDRTPPGMIPTITVGSQTDKTLTNGHSQVSSTTGNTFYQYNPQAGSSYPFWRDHLLQQTKGPIVSTYTLETALKLYHMYMRTDERGLLPHAFGPPGVGKTWVAEKMAELLGVNLHVINVSRMSPLEIEGIQMPVNDNTELKFLTASFWMKIKPGDIVLFDEFLRGFPEVYNAMLDIFTSRMVQGFKIPPSFWMAASNSIVTYDQALEDRMLHLPVPDIRKVKSARNQVAQFLAMGTGMHPDVVSSMEMQQLIQREIVPMYTMLDDLKQHRVSQTYKGSSVRNLIAQVNLRQIESAPLRDLVSYNNTVAHADLHLQIYTVVPDPEPFRELLKSNRLTPIQRRNAEMHVELGEMHEQLHVEETEEYDDDEDFIAS